MMCAWKLTSAAEVVSRSACWDVLPSYATAVSGCTLEILCAKD
jgi:hypothetical protein